MRRWSFTIVVAVLLAFVAVGIVGCTGGTDDTGTGNATSQDTTANDGATTGGNAATGDTAAPTDESAIDIAQAYFVAGTDYTEDQFDWVVQAKAKADDGTWYARVSATPSDSSLETEQIYVYSPSESNGFWFALDMGTGIDPMTDDRFPEEVREALAP